MSLGSFDTILGVFLVPLRCLNKRHDPAALQLTTKSQTHGHQWLGSYRQQRDYLGTLAIWEVLHIDHFSLMILIMSTEPEVKHGPLVKN